eukprot:4322643-Amphidinium_carterae.1
MSFLRPVVLTRPLRLCIHCQRCLVLALLKEGGSPPTPRTRAHSPQIKEGTSSSSPSCQFSPVASTYTDSQTPGRGRNGHHWNWNDMMRLRGHASGKLPCAGRCLE